MSGMRNPLNEASAFFDLFLRSDWTSCHVRGETIELFATRQAGHTNPMIGVVGDGGAAVAPDEETVLTAPHLGTLVELATIGSTIAAGERYGLIELLGEPIELVADRAGTIARHIGKAGALVQYEEALVTLH